MEINKGMAYSNPPEPSAKYHFAINIYPTPVYISVVANNIEQAREKARAFYNDDKASLQLKSIEEVSAWSYC